LGVTSRDTVRRGRRKRRYKWGERRKEGIKDKKKKRQGRTASTSFGGAKGGAGNKQHEWEGSQKRNRKSSPVHPKSAITGPRRPSGEKGM